MRSLRLGSTVAGKYRLDAIIGKGGMGAVFRAHHLLMDMPVALKVLHPTLSERPGAKERFLREARVAARVRHPNVVVLYDVDVHDDALFMVMELLEGESFALFMRRPEVSLFDKLSLLLDGMAGVSAVHQQGIVHRDIKPENIFVVHDSRRTIGSARILDFGISKLCDDAVSAQLTESGATIGTPMYMSSEQLRGMRDVDARTDVYSFGVLLYEVLTERHPFAGATSAAIALEMHTARPRSVKDCRPGVSAELNHVVMKAMALQRDDRYESIGALVAALSPVVETEQRRASSEHSASSDVARFTSDAITLDVPPPQVAPQPSSETPEASSVLTSGPSRRRGAWIAASAGAIVAVTAIVAWFAAGRGDITAQPPAALHPHSAPEAPDQTSRAAPAVPPTAQPPSREANALEKPSLADAEATPAISTQLREQGGARPSNRRAHRELRAIQNAQPVEFTPAIPAVQPTAPLSEAARGVRSGELRRDEL